MPAAPSNSRYVPGVSVAVLREALDLMQVQGETVVAMIESAQEITTAQSSDAASQLVSDPLLAQNIDLFV